MIAPRRRRLASKLNATAVAAAACSLLLTCSCGSAVGDEAGPPRTPFPAAQQNTAPPAKAPLMDTPPAAVTAPDDTTGLKFPPDQPVSLVVPDKDVRDIQDRLRSFGEPGIKSTGILDPATQTGIARFQRCLPETERRDAIGEVYRSMQRLYAVGWTFKNCDGAFDSPPLVTTASMPIPADTAPAAEPGTEPVAVPGGSDTLADAPVDAPPDSGEAPTETLPPQVATLPAPPPPPPPVDLKVGAPAYAIESISCEGTSGSWVLLYRGTVAALGADSVDIDVDSRIGLRYWPDAEGVNETEWFCVPRRRFCYAPVAFTDWKGKVKINDRISSSRSQVFDDQLGPRGVQQFIQSKCGS